MIQRIKCLFGHHQYYVIEHYSKDVRKLGCRCCKKQFGMNDRVRILLEWDDELEKQHEFIRSLPHYN